MAAKDIKRMRIVNEKDHYVINTINFIVKKQKGTTLNTDHYKAYYIEIQKIFNFIFDHPEEKDTRLWVRSSDGIHATSMTLAEALVHLYLWEPNVVFNLPISVKDFYDLSPMTKGKFNYLMNNILERFITDGIHIEKITQAVANIRQNLSQISDFFSSVILCSFDLFDIMAFESRNPSFRRLINTKLDDSYQSIKQMEDLLNDSKRIIEKTIMDDAQNTLYPYISAGVLNATQVVQMFVAVGPRADINKKILAKPISESYLKGIRDPMEFFIESVATLNSMIIKKKYVPEAGYLSRKINLLCLNTDIDYTIKDCGSQHYIEFFVETKKHLELIIGKYILGSTGKLKVVHKDDYTLIGKVISMRSHTTCITGHLTGQICETCVGQKAMILEGTRLGTLASIKVVNPLSQLAMSAKHQTSTKSEEIDDDIINMFFNSSSSRLYLNSGIDTSAMEIYLPMVSVEDAMVCMNEKKGFDDDGAEENLSASINEFYIKYKEEFYPISTLGKMFSFTITEEFIAHIISSISGGKRSAQDIDISSLNNDDEESSAIDIELIKVNAGDFDTNMPLFNSIILTEEVSVYLKTISGIINSTNTRKFTSVSAMISSICEIVIKSGIGITSNMVHIETIVRSLMRAKDSKIKRPNFSKDSPSHEYSFVMLNESIIKQNIFTGIAFEALKRQFVDIDMFQKTEAGVLDPWFMTSGMINRGIKKRKKRMLASN